MPVKITQGGITTEVDKSELDWYKRNGWTVVDEKPVADEAPAEPEAVAPVEKTDEAPAEKKTAKKK